MRLKRQRSMKALNISGDLPSVFSPRRRYVLLRLYKGKSDWIIPVTQKKLIRLEIKRNVSHEPISARLIWLFASTILTIRKTKNFSNWKSCRPDILSFILIFCKTLEKYLIQPESCQYYGKQKGYNTSFFKPDKDSNWRELWENKIKILLNGIFGLILQTENGGCSSVG